MFFQPKSKMQMMIPPKTKKRHITVHTPFDNWLSEAYTRKLPIMRLGMKRVLWATAIKSQFEDSMDFPAHVQMKHKAQQIGVLVQYEALQPVPITDRT